MGKRWRWEPTAAAATGARRTSTGKARTAGTATAVKAVDNAVNDYFGTSVALSSDGSTLAVGAIGKANGRGSAYVYRLKGNDLAETPLAEKDGAANDYFGFSVALSANGNTLAVGSDQRSVGSTRQQGEAYVVRYQ